MSDPDELDEPSDLDRLLIEMETARAACEIARIGYERGRIIYRRASIALLIAAVIFAVDTVWTFVHG